MMKSILALRRTGFSFLILLLLLQTTPANAQPTHPLLKRVQDRLNTVNNYKAEGILRTDVSFIRIPESKVTILFKNPDKFRIRKEEGISIVPKGGVNINLNALIGGKDYTAVEAGRTIYHGKPVAIIKLLPLLETSEVVLSTLYIDEQQAVVRKALTTTRDNGSYEMEFDYGKYLNYGLPDKITFLFNTKDYKLPKGVTFEYDPGSGPKSGKQASTQGKIEILYSSYAINKGISDSEFR